MRVFEKIKIKLRSNSQLSKLREFRFCGIPFLICKKKDKKKFYTLPNFTKRKNTNKDKLTFYLKVNREDRYSLLCLQHWIDIIANLNADYYILCDKKQLELKILRNIEFYDEDIKFIKSSNSKLLKKIVKNIATKFWVKATFAHLTTFEHSKANNIPYFWNIDADDTMFLVPPKKAAEIINEAQTYALKNNIDAFSFDMWFSKTISRHWSFGITFTNNKKDWFSIFENNKDVTWRKPYEQYDDFFNLDWFFTSLRDRKISHNETWYIGNMQFIHWGEFFTNVMNAGYCKWENNKLIFPILQNIFKSEFGEINVSSECIKLNYSLMPDECRDFAVDHLTYLNLPLKQIANLWR